MYLIKILLDIRFLLSNHGRRPGIAPGHRLRSEAIRDMVIPPLPRGSHLPAIWRRRPIQKLPGRWCIEIAFGAVSNLPNPPFDGHKLALTPCIHIFPYLALARRVRLLYLPRPERPYFSCNADCLLLRSGWTRRCTEGEKFIVPPIYSRSDRSAFWLSHLPH